MARKRAFTERDRAVLTAVMEVVGEELARRDGRPRVLFDIRDRFKGLWKEFEEEEVTKAMERGWDRGKGWPV